MPISQFVNKLLDMIENHSQLINWNKDGTQFTINDQSAFSQSVLPIYFRHTRFQSFIRQLNMYNFHKVCRRKNSVSFFNEYFRKGEKHLYHNITRRRQEAQAKSSMQFSQQIQKAKQLVQKCKQRPISILETVNKLLEFKRKSFFDVSEAKAKIQNCKKQLEGKLCKVYKHEFNFIKQGIQQIDYEYKKMEEKLQKILNSENQVIKFEQELSNSNSLINKQINEQYKTSQKTLNEHQQYYANENVNNLPRIESVNEIFGIGGYQSFNSISHFIS